MTAEIARKQRIAALTSPRASPTGSVQSPQSAPKTPNDQLADLAAAQMIEQAKADILKSRKGTNDAIERINAQSKVKQSRPESNPDSGEGSAKEKDAKNATPIPAEKSAETKAKKVAKKEQLATHAGKTGAHAAKREQKNQAAADSSTELSAGGTGEEADEKITTLSPEERSLENDSAKPKGACRSCVAGCFLM